MNICQKRISAAFAALLCAATLFADFRDDMSEHPVGVRDGLVLRAKELAKPRQMKVYIARIDLSVPGVGFVSTERPPEWGRMSPDWTNAPFRVDTLREPTAAFMKRRRAAGDNVEIAVNADPWQPFPCPSKFARLSGWNVSAGVRVSATQRLDLPMFIVRRDGTPEIRKGIPEAETNDVLFALRGFDVVMSGGKPAAPAARPNRGKPHPRTVFGLTPDRKTLVLAAIDGRQPGYSMGATYADVCEIMRAEGVSDAIVMDSGGSTSLVVWDRKNDRPWMLNRHAGRAVRPVAVNFGVTFPKQSSKLDLERLCGNLHDYEPPEEAETPPPEGWKPFYASHMGRHGARRIIGDHPRRAFDDLERIRKAGALNEKGLALRKAIAAVYDDWRSGMAGELTERGAEEHRGIARRLAARMGDAFAAPRRVRCQTTHVPRVMASMANFVTVLQEKAPALEFDFNVGGRYQKTVGRVFPAPSKEEAARLKAAKDVVRAREIKPDRFFKSIVTDEAKARAAIKSRTTLIRNVYECAADCQCLRTEIGGIDMYGFFEREDLEGLSRYWEASLYAAMGNSKEAYPRIIKTVRGLLDDIVARADAAIADDRVAADLRFGHDGGVWPLAGLIGVEGAGACVPIADIWKAGPVWKNVCVACNIQFIFYRRKPGDDPLVKILYNDREARLSGLEPDNGPFYAWSRLKKHFAAKKAEVSGKGVKVK